MTTEELDRVYTALCEAVGRAGEARAALLLGALSLDLLARRTEEADALAAIARAAAACDL